MSVWTRKTSVATIEGIVHAAVITRGVSVADDHVHLAHAEDHPTLADVLGRGLRLHLLRNVKENGLDIETALVPTRAAALIQTESWRGLIVKTKEVELLMRRTGRTFLEFQR